MSKAKQFSDLLDSLEEEERSYLSFQVVGDLEQAKKELEMLVKENLLPGKSFDPSLVVEEEYTTGMELQYPADQLKEGPMDFKKYNSLKYMAHVVFKETNEAEELRSHLPKGFVSYTGVKWADAHVKAYNDLQDKINVHIKKGEEVPQELLNGSHKLMKMFSEAGPKMLDLEKVQMYPDDKEKDVVAILTQMNRDDGTSYYGIRTIDYNKRGGKDLGHSLITYPSLEKAQAAFQSAKRKGKIMSGDDEGNLDDVTGRVQ
jgi:hypothetical protein